MGPYDWKCINGVSTWVFPSLWLKSFQSIIFGGKEGRAISFYKMHLLAIVILSIRDCCIGGTDLMLSCQKQAGRLPDGQSFCRLLNTNHDDCGASCCSSHSEVSPCPKRNETFIWLYYPCPIELRLLCRYLQIFMHQSNSDWQNQKVCAMLPSDLGHIYTVH